MSQYIPLTTLVKIARHIERVKGVTGGGTVNEMHARLKAAADTCMTIDQAVRAISYEVYNHPINGDYPATDAAIMSFESQSASATLQS